MPQRANRFPYRARDTHQTAAGLNNLRFAVYQGLALEMETAMLRIVSTLLMSGAIAFGGMSSASAQAERAESSPAAPAPVETPLAAGPAAGIRQAQGAQRDRIWTYVPFAVVGGLALLVVLATGNDDNDTAPTTTGTN